MKQKTNSKARKTCQKTESVNGDVPAATSGAENILAALLDYERVKATCIEIGATVEAARSLCERAEAAHFEAVKITLAAAKKAYVAAQEAGASAPPLPTMDDVYNLDGYAVDKDGLVFIDPNGNPVKLEDMFRKIVQQDWDI